MKLAKSSRHSKITGDFGESILLYLLSRHGFECARVDHTGIDLIARRPNSREVLGISVKSRSRQTGGQGDGLVVGGSWSVSRSERNKGLSMNLPCP